VLVGDDTRAKRRQEEIARLASKAQFAHIVESPDYAETGVPDVPTDIASDRSVRGATPEESEKGESPLPQIHGNMPTLDLSPEGERAELPRSHALKEPGAGDGDTGEGREATPEDPSGLGAPRKPLPAGGLTGGRAGSDGGAEGALSGGIGAGLPASRFRARSGSAASRSIRLSGTSLRTRSSSSAASPSAGIRRSRSRTAGSTGESPFCDSASASTARSPGRR
jgi:hypothetical protein